MRISPVNNQNFGYNKRLNERLKKRIEASEQTPIIQTIARVNDSCNFVEDKIRQLEKGYRGVDEHEAQINLLMDYFMDAKTFLCLTIERVFPELNYLKIECDTYDNESSNMELPEESSDHVGVRRAFLWRDMMVDGLMNEIENQTAYLEDPEDVANEINGKTQNKEYKSYLDVLKKEYDAEDRGESTLVEKFSPKSHSPKSLDDVVGLDLIRDDIKELIIYSIEHPTEAKEREEEYGIEIPHFIVFHGPPGCGKTMLAEAIAAQTGCDMYSMDLSKVGTSYINETAKNIRKAFDFVSKKASKSEKPVILFLDEMDSILSKRMSDNTEGSKEDNKSVNTLLTLITNAKDNNVIIIGATNMYNLIDPAAKRRINLEAYVGLPNQEEIKKLLVKELSKIKKGIPLSQNAQDIEELAQDLKGYSPSNIVNIVKASSKIAYKAQREIIKEDIRNAIKQGSWEKIKEQEYLPESKKPAKRIMGFN